MRIAFALLALTGAWGQSLEVTPSSVDRGSSNIFRILLTTPAGKEPAALQWEMAFPPEITIEVAGLVAGSAIEGTGKTLTCAARKGAEAGRAIACILAGGSKPIPAGPIAIVRYKAGETAPAGDVTVRLHNAKGASADLKKLVIADASGAITIR